MQRQYYVYIHRKKTNGEIFYVGKGFGNRCFTKSDRSLAWKNTVKKHDYTIEIVESGLQEWCAFELESELILRYGKKHDKSGILVNYTDGGEGESGRKHSAESIAKLKIAARLRGEDWKRKVSRLGSKHSEETKQKIGLASKGRTQSLDVILKRAETIRDNNVYTLIHFSGETYSGTRKDFISKYGVNIKPLFKSVPGKQSHGWRLINEQN